MIVEAGIGVWNSIVPPVDVITLIVVVLVVVVMVSSSGSAPKMQFPIW